MHSPSRPSVASDGSTEVTTTEQRQGDPPPVVGASAQTPSSNYGGERSFLQPGAGGGEPSSPSWFRTPAIVRGRTTFRFPVFRRSSSGYFSSDNDSLPSSPLFSKPVTADKATQTPSPVGQVVNHALQRMADEAHGGGPGTHRQHGLSPNPSSTQRRNAGRVMQAEAFGRQLRAIGDDYNRLLTLRRLAGRQRWDVIPLNLLPHIHQEPVAVFCVGLLLLLMGRLMYLQGSTNSQDHSQV